MIVSVTELHVRSLRYFIPFIYYSVRSLKQAKRSPGLIKAELGNKGWRIGYTFTVWNSKEDMMSFRDSGIHKQAMTRIRIYAIRFKLLNYETDLMPSLKDVLAKMDEIPLREM